MVIVILVIMIISDTTQTIEKKAYKHDLIFQTRAILYMIYTTKRCSILHYVQTVIHDFVLTHPYVVRIHNAILHPFIQFTCLFGNGL